MAAKRQEFVLLVLELFKRAGVGETVMGCAGLKVCRGEGNLGLREWDRGKQGNAKGIEVFLL